MPHTPTIMSLHLRYRIWIAELNFDINILRIFKDYLNEIESKRKEDAVKAKLTYFEKQFISVRNDIDDLRHEMHLLKMKLAALSRENKTLDKKTYEEDQHDIVRLWFNTNLECPTRFTAAKAPFWRKKNRALSWFKDTAFDHIAQIRGLVAILENHAVHVYTLKAQRVGYVVYEDEYQIVAEPFADMKC